MIDEISDNGIIIKMYGAETLHEYWSAYYLYNMIVPYSPLNNVDFFILF